MNRQDQLVQLEELALGSRLKRLSEQLMKETSLVYRELSIDFDPYHMPIFKLINEQANLTISEIGIILNVTQPAVTQYVNALMKKELILSKVGKIDKRKREICVSNKGYKLYNQLQPIWKIVDQEVKKLTHVTSNKTLLDHVTYVENELKEKSFSKRILENFVTNEN